MIRKVRPAQLPELVCLEQQVARLENLALRGENEAIIELMTEIIPTFRPGGLPSVALAGS